MAGSQGSQRPLGRQKNVTGDGKGVWKRGPGLGGGSVGGGSSHPPFGKVNPNRNTNRKSNTRSGSGANRVSLLAMLLAIAVCGTGLLAGQQTGITSGGGVAGALAASVGSAVQHLTGSGLAGGLFDLSGIPAAWDGAPNTGKLDRTVDPAAREKYTVLKGGGQDTATVMVYMCASDLESKNGMATQDLREMTAAAPGDAVNVVVYTGGCGDWRNETVSGEVNQVWKAGNGALESVERNAGDVAMTNPETLRTFLSYCSYNYPADRNILILWDHGGGSLAGYGYDERHPEAGALSLADVAAALSETGMKCDFIGFDACLMATAENALALSRCADYLIASEQTEPGAGWYYTDWLSALSENPSLPTVELGKIIADSFVEECRRTCRGQPATLSVTDLAELGETLGGALDAFGRDTRNLIQNSAYQQVSSARADSREFPGSIDQIDLVHFARNLGTPSGDALAETVLRAVKYNRTASITNAYGLSIYFPYRKVSSVERAIDTYGAIGLEGEYPRCVREFATVEERGQAAGAASPLLSLLGEPAAGVPDPDSTASGAAERFDPAGLVWKDGKLSLPPEQWALVQGLDLNLFYDDGEGFIDLGTDNVFSFDSGGNLLADFDGTWLSVNGQPVAYYRLDTAEEGESYTISGRVPVLLNGERADLILLFTDEAPGGTIAGARPVYENGETETAPRGLVPLRVGDTLDFLCDYYGYDGSFQDRYFLGAQMTVTEKMVLSNTDVGEGAAASYRFTDLYGQFYWTPPLP